jgi:exodeoxyribonuclease VII large subunit
MSLPVYTGIGHSTNETVCELIAFKNCITPTDLAYEIIEKFKDYDLRIETATQNLLQSSRKIFVDDASYLKSLSKNIQKQVHNLVRFQNKNLEDVSLKHTSASRRILQQKKNQLQQIKYRIRKQPLSSLQTENQNIAYQQRLLQIFSNRMLKTKQHKLESQEQRIKYLSPKHILQRVYSLILKEGKIVTNPNKLKKGDLIENLTAQGKITSKVLKTNETKKNEV